MSSDRESRLKRWSADQVRRPIRVRTIRLGKARLPSDSGNAILPFEVSDGGVDVDGLPGPWSDVLALVRRRRLRFRVLQLLVQLRDRLISRRDVLLALGELRFDRAEPLLELLAFRPQVGQLPLHVIVRAGGIRGGLRLELLLGLLQLAIDPLIGLALGLQSIFQFMTEPVGFSELGLQALDGSLVVLSRAGAAAAVDISSDTAGAGKHCRNRADGHGAEASPARTLLLPTSLLPTSARHGGRGGREMRLLPLGKTLQPGLQFLDQRLFLRDLLVMIRGNLGD